MAPMPDRFAPMLATVGELPDTAQDAQWGYETKWDGARAVAFLSEGRVRLLSRNDLDVSVSYPELRALGEQAGSGLILDGEIVAFGANGLSSFGRLQKRMHVSRAADADRLSRSDPVVYLVFDVLYRDGASTTALPYIRRRELLEALDLNGPSWQTPRYFVGGGAELLQASRQLGLEGIVAKRLNSAYRPGRRSPDWRKIKNLRTQEVVVGGWKPGNGRRAGTVGALLLGIPDEAGLRYVGKVGTGFTDAALDALLARFRPLARATSAFGGSSAGTDPSYAVPRAESADARWIEPTLVGEVVFGEWTGDGRLRHSVWRGLRPDKTPEEVRPES